MLDRWGDSGRGRGSKSARHRFLDGAIGGQRQSTNPTTRIFRHVVCDYRLEHETQDWICVLALQEPLKIRRNILLEKLG